MIVVLIALLVVACVQVYTVRTFAKRQEARDLALFKQQKAHARELQRTRQTAEEAIGQTQHLQENTRLIAERVERALNDPNLQKVLRRS